MAKANCEIICMLRSTAKQLAESDLYQWGHMGSCNCGFLVQQITKLSKAEIHRRAMERTGDWNEQLNDYCASSGLLFDDMVTAILSAGFDISDLRHLENLSDPKVLATVNHHYKLRHNVKDDVILYLRGWADLLESKLLEEIQLPAEDMFALKSH